MLDHRFFLSVNYRGFFLSVNYREGNSWKHELFRSAGPSPTAYATRLPHACIFHQIATAMIATTIAAPTTGEIFFELPLRGESLAAWLNSVLIT
jgi:hypothetical protein